MSAIELFWTKLGADGDSIGNLTWDPSQNSFVNIEVDAARMDAENPSPSLHFWSSRHEGHRVEGTPLAQENLSTGTINPPTFSLASETVSLPDIGIVSAKTFGFGEGDALHTCIVAPAPFFQSNFSNTWSDLNSGAGFHRLPAGNWNRSPNLIGTLGHDVPRTHDQTLSPSSGPQLIDHDSAPLAQAADGQSSGTSLRDFFSND